MVGSHLQISNVAKATERQNSPWNSPVPTITAKCPPFKRLWLQGNGSAPSSPWLPCSTSSPCRLIQLKSLLRRGGSVGFLWVLEGGECWCSSGCISEICMHREPDLPKPYQCYLVLFKGHLFLGEEGSPSRSSSLLYLSPNWRQHFWQKPPLARVHTRNFVELLFCSLTPANLCLDNKMEAVKRLMWWQSYSST